MTMAKKQTALKTWDELRPKYVTAENEARIAEHSLRMLSEVRAARLADARKQRHLTQAEVAAAMGVTQTRVSQIEHGRIERSEVDTLASYVAALGGQLSLVADFGDEQLRLA
jgi:predicted XRE-type DNA-binding protein